MFLVKRDIPQNIIGNMPTSCLYFLKFSLVKCDELLKLRSSQLDCLYIYIFDLFL